MDPYTDATGNPMGIVDVQKQKGKIILDCLGNGLAEDDALVLADMSPEEFELYKKEHPRFEYLVDKKKIEYKQTLLKPITGAIKDGDAKMAQWMLERQYNEEFSNKRRPDATKEQNPIAIIINAIQTGQAGLPTIPGGFREIIREEQAAVK